VTLPLSSFVSRLPPRLELGTYPSPLEDRPELARHFGAEILIVKREDLNGSPFGGNKLRAIEWLLPTCGRAMVTMGGYGSTWCAALAAASEHNQARVHAALFPQPWSPTVAGTLSTTIARGEVHLAASRWGLPGAIVAAWRGARRDGPVNWLPAGGATPVAVLGSVNAALELVAQVSERGWRRPDAIVVPLGTGGTAAGLLVGMWLAGWKVEICAVRVTDPWYANRHRVLSLARKTLAVLRELGAAPNPGPASLRVVGDQLGSGYGHPTPAGEELRSRMADAGITVDLTYGAKACAAIATLASSFPAICLWHTFDARLVSQPLQEHPLLRSARGHAEMLWPHLKSI
jgi:1-aminocyclopropane-1-carboxylate deaminase/D-cysteine desulfhydrase-like pyridoxal-dependent ACC family enzyme